MRPNGIALLFLATLIASSLALLATAHADRHDDDDDDDAIKSDNRVVLGFSMAPVRLDLEHRKKSLVGLGSYFVNAVAGCNDCHTCPSYAPGHSPYTGGDGAINSANYLAGGVHFGPFTSANITPDASGRPAGLTLEQFITTIRSGKDPQPPHDILQVMPWPVFRKMTDRDLTAIYEYLSAIPHATPGNCGGPGE
jgi:hypothetical protein